MSSKIPDKEHVLPPNLRALLQEHSAGGFLLIKIDAHGTVQNILEYDNEMSYHAIMRKCALFLEAMTEVDGRMVMSSLFPSRGAHDGFFDDDEEDDEDGQEGGEENGV